MNIEKINLVGTILIRKYKKKNENPFSNNIENSE